MATSYVKSDQIKAFPVVNRNTEASGDTYAKHTSEATLAGIVNKLIDSDGFVITPRNKIKLDGEFAFNIYGYYFNVAKLQYILEAVFKKADINSKTWPRSVYAVIDLEKNGQWLELAGSDETSEVYNDKEKAIDPNTYQYTSVKFTTTLDTDNFTENTHYIELFLLSKPGSNDTEVVLPSDDLKLDFSWKDTNNNNVYEIYVKNNNYIKFSGISFKIDGGDLNPETSEIV